MTRYAHALSSHTPKDTLLTLNTLPESSHDDSLLVLGLVFASSEICIPSASLAASWYGDTHQMRNYPINFVVKHPNRLDSSSRRPALGRLKPAGPAFLLLEQPVS